VTADEILEKIKAIVSGMGRLEKATEIGNVASMAA
jgi:hypothetical protein